MMTVATGAEGGLDTGNATPANGRNIRDDDDDEFYL